MLLCCLVLLGGCGALYETASDVQARQALLDLIRIQGEYHQKNNRYARNLVQISEGGYTLKYHTGIVYLEIEAAGPNSWRAVALPAESTSARVFAFDTKKGGLYEMDDEEVSDYVLGALNFIRSQQLELLIRDVYAGTLILVMAWFGFKSWRGNKAAPSSWMALCFFLSLPPLTFTALTLNHMDKDIVLSGLLQTLLTSMFLHGGFLHLGDPQRLPKSPSGKNRELPFRPGGGHGFYILV
ncbi:MAG: hypothetical protein ACE5ER_00075 [Nitrospinaceae bacterium]